MKSPLRSVASVLRTTAFPAHVPAADETASNPSTDQPLLGGGGGMAADVVGGEAIDVVDAGVVVVVGAVVVATARGDELELDSGCVVEADLSEPESLQPVDAATSSRKRAVRRNLLRS